MSYLLLSRVEVSGANAQSAYPVISGISPLAYLGFARKLALIYSNDICDRIGVSILHHDIEMHGEMGYRFQPAQYRGAALTTTGKRGKSDDYVGGGMSMSLQPTARCDVSVSLILSGINKKSEAEIRMDVLRMRIAGGHIASVGKIKWFESYDEAVQRAGSGYFVVERSDILGGAEDKVRAMLLALASRKVGDGWIVPVGLGYLPVTESSKKEGVRGDLLHTYAEPLIGLVQYRSGRNIRKLKEPIPVWRYGLNKGAFVATTAL
ncbi:MAG: hypothetical protein KGI54_01690 [Pseudomonadota bacterium]|nr:hypothetical protein [Pseudomonadota bacterium]